MSYLCKRLQTWFLLRWRCSRHPAIERQIWAWIQQKTRSNCKRPRRAFLEWRRRSYRQLNKTIQQIFVILASTISLDCRRPRVVTNQYYNTTVAYWKRSYYTMTLYMFARVRLYKTRYRTNQRIPYLHAAYNVKSTHRKI